MCFKKVSQAWTEYHTNSTNVFYISYVARLVKKGLFFVAMGILKISFKHTL